MDLWKGSDHDLAMQEVSRETVLGDFNNSTFTHHSVTSRFYMKDGKYFVETEGRDGKIGEFELKYVFGIRPLQQYLVEFDRGYIQTLPICWDTRPEEMGGQRWFHIYDQEKIAPDDILYWTRIYQNWNFMCAECHSTNLLKNYNLDTDTYETSYSEIDVSCEACHGPGSAHVEWAKNRKETQHTDDYTEMGLMVQLKDPGRGTWVFSDESGNARRTVSRNPDPQVEMCARCHARRSVIDDKYVHGQPFMQTHLPQLLDEGMYFADGQILEEVYVYSSFLQSKMYHKGVVCADCHEPHSGKIYAQGNALCYRCHTYEKFGTRTHHFHNPDSTGASCVDCHMPERKYMVIDPRRDHSIRIPRPDISVAIDVPNSCNQCHYDKSYQWASDKVLEWYGPDFKESMQFAEIIQGARNSVPGAGNYLIQLVGDTSYPAIVRATGLSLINRYPSRGAVEAVRINLYDTSPLVRIGAIRSLNMVDLRDRLNMAKHLLTDPILAVRTEVAFVLSETPRNLLTSSEFQSLQRAIAEYIKVQLLNGDRPSSLLNLGVLYMQLGEWEKAETIYNTAIKLEPVYMLSYVNLADLYRQQGRDGLAEEILRNALEINPQVGEVHQALGLLLTRTGKRTEALEHFKVAMEFQAEDAYSAYIYGLALHDAGETKQGLEVFRQSLKHNPYSQDILVALVTINRDVGNFMESHFYAQKLTEYWPNNPGYLRLLQEIPSQKN
jgi:predicted CXXCH cytochrome family protein